jgi:hypothetical protein
MVTPFPPTVEPQLPGPESEPAAIRGVVRDAAAHAGWPVAASTDETQRCDARDRFIVVREGVIVSAGF